ncbi:MAG: hypothetical protein WBC44_05345 [Planctomycetaceae bacterium]
MSADLSWLYGLVNLVSASLIIAMYLAGLVISLFRWNDGVTPRLATIGFGLMLLSNVANQILYRFFFDGWGNESMFYWLMVLNAATTLLNLTAWALLLVALRRAFLDAARWRSEFSSDR